MTVTTFALLVLAGIGGGLCGYLTGLASLVTYPALLAVGLTPVSANATNTIAVLGIGIGSTVASGSRLRELGPRRLGRDSLVALIGGGIGAGLLLLGGDGAFSLIVPWLIAAASVALLLQPRLSRLRGEIDTPAAYLIGLFFTCIYGGYFGAGAGVIYLALCLLTTTIGFTRSMMLKSMLLGVSNLAAAVIFIVLAPIGWWAALAMGLGCFLGGRLGPPIQQFLPRTLLRYVIAAAGFGLAIWLAVSS